MEKDPVGAARGFPDFYDSGGSGNFTKNGEGARGVRARFGELGECDCNHAEERTGDGGAVSAWIRHGGARNSRRNDGCSRWIAGSDGGSRVNGRDRLCGGEREIN